MEECDDRHRCGLAQRGGGAYTGSNSDPSDVDISIVSTVRATRSSPSDGVRRRCLLCIHMPAIDRSLSDCRYVRRATMSGTVVRQYPDITHTISDQWRIAI